YPVLKKLGFPATLFVYTDYVGASRNALSWEQLKGLAAEGFDVQAHSKTHGDLRRATGETDAQYAKRMQAELAEPPRLFQRQLGQGVQFLAYPYGRVDDDDAEARANEARLTSRIEGLVSTKVAEARGAHQRNAPLQARRALLAALALDPMNTTVAELLRSIGDIEFVTYTVRAGDTLAS